MWNNTQKSYRSIHAKKTSIYSDDQSSVQEHTAAVSQFLNVAKNVLYEKENIPDFNDRQNFTETPIAKP